MRVKLDENLGLRTMAVFEAAGHDVATVAGQQMAGATDADLLAAGVGALARGNALQDEEWRPFRNFELTPQMGKRGQALPLTTVNGPVVECQRGG